MTAPVVVVALAGSGRRFSRVGVMSPKWAIRLDGRSLFEHAVDAVAPLLDAGAELRVVLRRPDCETPDFLAAADRLGREFTVARVEGRSSGQAVDAAAALTARDADRPVVIWGVDALLDCPDLTERLEGVGETNWLLTAPIGRSGPGWAQIGPDGMVEAIAEAHGPGADAVVGMYGFASARSVREQVLVNQAAGPFTAASLAGRFAGRGAPVVAVRVPPGSVTPLGTPDEMLAACRASGWPTPIELLPYTSGRRR